MKQFYSILFLLILLTLTSCIEKTKIGGFSGNGKKPIYIDFTELLEIKNLTEQAVQNSGPIYLLDSLFFMTEMNKGIHVYNIKDSLNIGYETFIKIPAVTDFTVEDNYIFANNWTNLVIIDFTNLYQIQLVNVQENTFEPLLYPTLYDGIFECVDLEKGAVIGWQNLDIENVKCTTF